MAEKFEPCVGKWSTCGGTNPRLGGGWNLCDSCTAARSDAMRQGKKKPDKGIATFEVTGEAGCPICTPLVGDRFTADALTAEMSAGAFHNGCQHGIEKVADDKMSADAKDAFDTDDIAAVHDYQTASAGVNGALRGGYKSPREEALIARMDRAFSRAAPIQTDAVLYRGVPYDVYVRQEIAMLKAKEKGRAVHLRDRAFVSTSASRERADYFATVDPYSRTGMQSRPGKVVEMRIPAGTRVIKVDEVSGRDMGDQEWLLPRGMKWQLSFEERMKPIYTAVEG